MPGDLDLQAVAINAASNALAFDLTSDGLVDTDDRDRWIEELRMTWYGDANLDGEFNSGDLVSLFSAGEFEDAIALNSIWTTGDFNGDGDFDSSDLVAAFADGGFEQGPRAGGAATQTVPEPTCAVPMLGLFVVLLRRKLNRTYRST